MANTVRIKRRAAGGASGAPGSLANAELAFNEQDDTLYYGKGTGGAGGTATTVEAIGGKGAFCTLTGNQTIAGVKTFSSTITGSISGNAGTATILATARTIGGVSFDGSANINLPGVNTAGNQNTSGTAANVTGTVAVANGGSGTTTAQGAMNAFAGGVTSGSYLRGNGTNVVMSAIQAGDVPTLNQSTTGNAATATALQTGRILSFTGDATGAFAAFNGTSALAAALTLATVNSNVGTFNRVTVNAKGLVTAATDGTLTNIPAPTADYSIGGYKLTNVATPTLDTDAANKAYVDSVAQGLDVKNSVKVATTANISLSGTQTIDGIAVIAGDRVLVRAQSTQSANGIYIVAAGAWTRALDADTYNELISAFVFIEQGSTLADTGWVCSADPGGTLGSTAIVWSQFSGAGSYSAGTGLTLSGSQFSITNTAVSAASYGSASNTLSITVNAQGQLTSASAQAIAIANTQVSGLGTASTQNTGTSGSAIPLLSGANTWGNTQTIENNTASPILILKSDKAARLRLQNTDIDTDIIGEIQSYSKLGSEHTDSLGGRLYWTVENTGFSRVGWALAGSNSTETNILASTGLGVLTYNGNTVYHAGNTHTHTLAQISNMSAYARTLNDDADAATARATLELGTMSTQAASAVNITGGTIDNITIDGGTF